MKTLKAIILFTTLLLLTSCGNKKGNYDASGTFEATEVLVSAQASGQILQLDVTEGQTLEAGKEVGWIDTVQLYLKKKQLLAGMKAVDSRTYNVSLQIASLKQQIAKQQTELARFRNLVQSNAATQKQVDDKQRGDECEFINANGVKKRGICEAWPTGGLICNSRDYVTKG
ncbi:hypothetical protein FACS189428_4310 [Clostridia bacterium]|nr:hypothetical protein FACS189428_4310 [Clostridia bacterium]